MPDNPTHPPVFFQLPPSDPSRMVRWGQDLVTSLRRLQATGAFDNSNINDRIGELETAVSEIAITETADGLLTAQQIFILGLVSAVDTLTGSFADFYQRNFEWSQQAAREGIRTLARGHIDRGFGRTIVINEQRVRETETTALAQNILAVNAAIASTNANVTVIQQAYIDGDNALALDITQVETTVAGNTAAVTQLTTSVNGISARWGVSVNAQGQVLGTVQLDGSASGSTFTVMANTFQVAQPGVSGGTPVPVFVIGTLNGAPGIGIRGDVYLDGSIVARHLAVSSLSAITANIGDVTAGVLRSADNKFRIDLNAKTIELIV